MLAHRRSLAALLVLLAAAVVGFVPACEKIPLTAPSGSIITLTASTNAVPLNGSVELIAWVLEASGTPPHSGTHVTFTTTLGRVEPADAVTDLGGRAVARFLGSANGTAVITASSGGATTGTDGAVRIAVGTAAVGRVLVSASPATVLNSGGSTVITATVVDLNGNALNGAPVTFSTTAGTLTALVVPTDASGQATTVLTTSQQATVRATVGIQASGGNGGTGGTSASQTSAEVMVTVSAAPTVIITPPAVPSAGLPASFTFAVTVPANGSAVRSLVVNWGDGDSQNLGAVTGSQSVSHVYSSAGTYTVTATVTDAAGNSSTVSTAVTVIPVPRPSVLVTPSPQTQVVGGLVTFSVQITAPPGIGIVRTSINLGDGEIRQLGGASSASVPKTYSTAGVFTVTVTVTDTVGQVTEGTTAVNITASPG